MYARWVHLHRTADGEPIARPTLHRLALDALYGAMFPPNLVLVDAASLDDAELSALVAACEGQQRGLAVLVADPQAPPITAARDVTVWVGDRSPTWEIGLRIANLDLPLLAGMLLATWRDGRLRLATAVADPEQIAPARAFLDTLVELGRLPGDTERRVAPLPFAEALDEAPAADVTLLGLPLTPRVDGIRAMRDRVGGTCLFLKDSGRESVLA
jgi:hypothetical protein